MVLGLAGRSDRDRLRYAVDLGFIGGLPYLGASATTVYLARQAQLAASGAAIGIDPGVAITLMDQALNLQVTYGAVMLSFLGQSPSLLLFQLL